MFKILIVCTGNTCRSPMAEGILKNLLAERGVTNVEVSSAGIGAMQGMTATPHAIEVARHWGIDISSHRARQLTQAMTSEANLILAMAPEHVQSIIRRDPSAARKTFLMKGFPEPYSVSQEGVADPIGGTLDEYHQTYLELDEILRRNLNMIASLSNPLEEDS